MEGKIKKPKGYQRQPQELAKMFAAALANRLLYDEETKSYWFHDVSERVWRPLGQDVLFDDLSAFVEEHGNVDMAPSVTTNRVMNVVKQLRRFTAKKKNVSDDTHITFNDCQLNLTTLESEAYQVANFAVVSIPCDYAGIEQATSPIFDGYIKDTCVRADGTYNPTKYNQLSEIAGFTLMTDRMEKAVYLTGRGSNGKSPFIEILRALVGETRCHSATLMELTTQGFNLCDLVGKKLNAKGEEESEKVNLSRIKEIISGEPVTARRLYESNFTFRVRCRFVFSSNWPPRLDGFDYAIRRRFFVVPFLGNVSDAKADKDIGKKMVTQELPALVRFAIAGIRRLRAQNRTFTESEETKLALDTFEIANNSALEFLSEHYSEDIQSSMLYSALYLRYVDYCKESGRRAMSRNRFGRECTARYGESYAMNNQRYYHCREMI